ncbi:MAG TPA: LysR family transcriptional regulator [Novosphingobium sp.]|nr:LysR family transcriptional regulator [Novosphingobium sp.]HZV11281.1 LysR family transcriptional regulator [Novosphingobium sp.]
MELRHLRYFLAVAEERNFTRAAARVGIGQPPLSQQIRDLEAEVGTPLFRRLPQGAELTAAGRAFEAAIARIPGQVADAVRAAQRAARGEIGALRVGFTGSAAMNPIVPATIRTFRHRAPDVALTLSESNTTTLIAGLRDGSIDVAFIRPSESDLQGLHALALLAEPLLAAVPTGHPALGQDGAAPIDLRALAQDHFILTPRAIGPCLFDAAISLCEAAGFTPRLGQAAPQIASVLSLVAATEGVSIVPASMRQLSLEGVAYREISHVSATVRLSLAHMSSNRSPLVQRFLAVGHDLIATGA